MKLLKKLYNHPTLSDEVGAKRINRASIIMMMLFAPLFIISLVLSILTTNISAALPSGGWFALVSFASMKLQTGSQSARKGVMIISLMSLLGGILLLSKGDVLLLLGCSILFIVSSAYVFFSMWGRNSPVMKELSARRREYLPMDITE